MTSYALIVACLQRIALLEWSKQRLLLRWLLLLRELDVTAIGSYVGEESTSLSYSIVPRLIPMQDKIVALGVLLAIELILTLERINGVPYFIEIMERFRLNTCCKSWGSFGTGTHRRTLFNIREF